MSLLRSLLRALPWSAVLLQVSLSNVLLRCLPQCCHLEAPLELLDRRDPVAFCSFCELLLELAGDVAFDLRDAHVLDANPAVDWPQIHGSIRAHDINAIDDFEALHNRFIIRPNRFTSPNTNR